MYNFGNCIFRRKESIDVFNCKYIIQQKMSFFKKLLKIAGERVIDSFSENVINNNSSSNNSYNNYNNSNNITNKPVYDEERCRNNIEQVISNEYVGYDLRRNVPSTEMYATDNAVDYTYGLYRNGFPVLFINVIGNRNDYSLLRFRRAKEAAVANGVPHLNFFSHLPNEISYISNRIRANIK